MGLSRSVLAHFYDGFAVLLSLIVRDLQFSHVFCFEKPKADIMTDNIELPSE